MDEFRLIARILATLEAGGAPQRDPRVVIGPGDDAAVFRVETGRLVATTDCLVEDTHFRWDLCKPEDVGYKAVAVNLSDLAAMGAHPTSLVMNLSVSRRTRDATVLRVARGMAGACREFGVGVSGGNVAETWGPFEVTVTALGEPVGGRVLTRGGARVGDGVFVSGPVGAAALGLAVLERARRAAWRFPGLVRAWRRPRPRLDLAAALVGNPAVHAAIDVSDGLLQDLGHVLCASRLGAEVEVERFPRHPEADKGARVTGRDPLEAALAGGEDYELVVCASPEAEDALAAAGFTRIGTLLERIRPRIRLTKGGRPIPLPPRMGFRHR